MKALVLGATGFIGSHIVRALLKEGVEVRCLMRSSSSALALEGLSYEEAIGDLDDRPSLERAMKGCDLVFHSAAYYPQSSLLKKRQMRTAIRQMGNLLKAAAGNSHLARLIYTSSLSTIGRPEKGLADEETPYDPGRMRGLYYDIKYRLESQALEAARRGLPVVVVNPTAVFGDYDVKPTSGIFVVLIAKKKIPFLIDAKMNVVDVQDVARGHVLAWKQGQIGRRYILSGENTTVRELAQRIASLAGVRPPPLRLPLFVGDVAATFSEYLALLLRRRKPFLPKIGIDFLRNGQHYNGSRARTELGFTASPVDKALQRALDWFRDHQYLPPPR